MTTRSTDARDLIILAERMSIPVDEAMRQVAQMIADVEPEAVPATARTATDQIPAQPVATALA